MFAKFRENVKIRLFNLKLTYSQLGAMSGMAESTIKGFMCGATDSRRIAERIADSLNCILIYSDGIYDIKDKEET